MTPSMRSVPHSLQILLPCQNSNLLSLCKVSVSEQTRSICSQDEELEGSVQVIALLCQTSRPSPGVDSCSYCRKRTMQPIILDSKTAAGLVTFPFPDVACSPGELRKKCTKNNMDNTPYLFPMLNLCLLVKKARMAMCQVSILSNLASSQIRAMMA